MAKTLPLANKSFAVGLVDTKKYNSEKINMIYFLDSTVPDTIQCALT